MEHSLTIIIPAYNEAAIIEKTATVLTELFTEHHITHNLLIVDDGSTDDTWPRLAALAQKNNSIHGIRLSRNFGKENAIFAGLSHADGDCVIVMDGDLQHPPQTALAMFRLWAQGHCDIVEGVKIHRQSESLIHRVSAECFYGLLQLLSGLSLQNMSDFKLLSRRAADIIKHMPERYAFFRALPGWTGLRTEKIYFETAPRSAGDSKFKVTALTKLAVNSLTSYSSAPLQWVTLAGAGFSLFAVALGVQTLYMKVSGQSVEGFTTVILLLLLIGGVLMFSLGIIGLYIAKIYDEIKQRPRYIISEKTGEV